MDEQGLTPLPADAPWWAKWLRDNWRVIFREFSTWFFGAIGIISLAAEAAPMWLPELTPYLSGRALHTTTLILAVAGIVAKLVKQKNLPPADAPVPLTQKANT